MDHSNEIFLDDPIEWFCIVRAGQPDLYQSTQKRFMLSIDPITQQPPRTFTALVQEGMAHAERIIKSVMLPIGSPASGNSGTPLPVSSSISATSSTNPFDSLVNEPSNSQQPPISTGFATGPVTAKAASAFVKSFLQLIPTADRQVLQKVIDMKVSFTKILNLILENGFEHWGIKRSDQIVIIDEFQSVVKNNPTPQQEKPSAEMRTTEIPHSASSGNVKGLWSKK
ncbi:hypothetical protein ACTXT7_011281 [Hymenolepis weldensis]